MTQLYLMPNGKIATQNGKPVLMEQDDFTECCCEDEFISYKFVQTGLTGGGLDVYGDDWLLKYYTYYNSATFMGAGFDTHKGDTAVSLKFNFEKTEACGGSAVGVLPDWAEDRRQSGVCSIKLNITKPLTITITSSSFYNKTNHMTSIVNDDPQYLPRFTYWGRGVQMLGIGGVPNTYPYYSHYPILEQTLPACTISDSTGIIKTLYRFTEYDQLTTNDAPTPPATGTFCNNTSSDGGWVGEENPYVIQLEKGVYDIVIRSEFESGVYDLNNYPVSALGITRPAWFWVMTDNDFDMTDIDFSRPVPTEVPYV